MVKADGPATAVWTDHPGTEPPWAPDALLIHLPESAPSTRSQTIHLVPPSLLVALTSFFCEDLARERLALLTGRVWRFRSSHRWLVHVTSHHRVEKAHASALHVAMQSTDWPQLWPALDSQADPLGEQLIGWAHSHPVGGLFFSPTDRATQASWFAQPWSLALVFAPGHGHYTAFTGPYADATEIHLKEPSP